MTLAAIVPPSRKVMNLAHFLTQCARRYRDQPGLVWGERRWTWGEIDARVSAMAAVLRERGIGKGDRVLVHSKNCNQMFESMFACFRLGAVWVPTNYRLMPDDVVHLAEASGANAFLCHAEAPAHAQAVANTMPTLAFLAHFGERGTFGENMDQLTLSWPPSNVMAALEAAIQSQTLDLDAVALDGRVKPGHDNEVPGHDNEVPGYDNEVPGYDNEVPGRDGSGVVPNADVEYDDPCWFFFTSGTTGKPKAGVLTHGQMAFVVTNHLCDLTPATTNADASLVVAPLSHGAGIHQLMQTARGARTVLLATDKLDCAEVWRTVQRERITNMFTVPTILKLMTEHPAVDAHDHSSLRYVIYAGAPMYREDQKHALRKLGKVIVQYFGLGEVTGNICVFPRELHEIEDTDAARIGTCGYERTGIQVSIQGPDGRELAPGETGEICVIGPAVFAGYYNNPDANAAAFRNGWFRTGDLGHMDAGGFVYITGRASDMYISGGSNIYPREVEEKILMHPAIAEAAVVGVPDREWGEVGYAVCVAREGFIVNETELLTFIASKVARYKMPKRVFFWDELPKSGYGKITKKMIREELEVRGLLGDTSNKREALR